MDNFNLKEYIQKVYQLEISLFKQKELRKSLSGQINVYNRGMSIMDTKLPPNASKEQCIALLADHFLAQDAGYKNLISKKEKYKFSHIFNGGSWFIIVIAAAIIGFFSIGGLAGIFTRGLGDIFKWCIGATLCYIIYCFISLIVHNVRIKRENNKIQEQNIAIDISNKNRLAVRNNQLKLMKDEYSVLNNSIAQTEKLLREYYDFNVIYPKYRNIVAISSFYEYLESGRCSSLEGHEGAYNIYESELRANLIIAKLDTIIEQLESIRENQYMLYSAIQESKQSSEKIIKMLESIDTKCNDISKSADITAYNSRISADNSEFLKWLSIFKNKR